MSTKWGITALVVGGYLLAIGIGGINANEGAGATTLFALVLMVGFVIAGWAVVLPWDGEKPPAADDVPDRASTS